MVNTLGNSDMLSWDQHSESPSGAEPALYFCGATADAILSGLPLSTVCAEHAGARNAAA